MLIKSLLLIFSLSIFSQEANGQIAPYIFLSSTHNCAAVFIKSDTFITSQSCKKAFNRDAFYLKSTEGEVLMLQAREFVNVRKRNMLIVRLSNDALEKGLNYPLLSDADDFDRSEVKAQTSLINGEVELLKANFVKEVSKNVVAEQSEVIKNGELLTNKLKIAKIAGMPLVSLNEAHKVTIHALSEKTKEQEKFVAVVSLGSGGTKKLDYRKLLDHLVQNEEVSEIERDKLLINFIGKSQASMPYLRGWLKAKGHTPISIKRVYKKTFLTLYHL